MGWKVNFVIAAAVLFSVFILQNMDTIDIRFLFWSLKVNRLLLLVLVWGAGILTGWLAAKIAGNKNDKPAS